MLTPHPSQPSIPPAAPTASQPTPQFNDEKEHYKSLISLLKYSITIVSVIISLIGFGLGYITYSNGQEMKDALKAERQEMKDNLAAMKADVQEQKDALKEELETQADKLKNKELEMQQNVDDQIQYLQGKVDAAEQQAQGEIASFRSVATEQARSKIEQIFRENNFDQFVTNVAKERMEPQIQAMVDRGLNKVEEQKQTKINAAIESLKSENQLDVNYALNYLNIVGPTEILSEQQIEKIIKVYDNGGYNSVDQLAFLLTLVHQKSKIVKSFFEKILLNPYENFQIKDFVLEALLTTQGARYEVSFYEDVVIKHSGLKIDALVSLTKYPKIVTKQMFLEILNNIEIVNSWKKDLPNMNFLNDREFLKKTLIERYGLKEEQLIKTLFFTTMQN